MRSEKKLAIGAIFAAFGGAGIVLGPLLGFSKLGSPWSFILGFVFGVMAGVGAVLSLFHLSQMKN